MRKRAATAVERAAKITAGDIFSTADEKMLSAGSIFLKYASHKLTADAAAVSIIYLQIY